MPPPSPNPPPEALQPYAKRAGLLGCDWREVDLIRGSGTALVQLGAADGDAYRFGEVVLRRVRDVDMLPDDRFYVGVADEAEQMGGSGGTTGSEVGGFTVCWWFEM